MVDIARRVGPARAPLSRLLPSLQALDQPAPTPAPTPAPVDPRITATRGAVGDLAEGADRGLGQLAALSARGQAAVGGGLGRLVGLVDPDIGTQLLAGADRLREGADAAASRGFFDAASTGALASPGRRTAPAEPRVASAPAAPAVPDGPVPPRRPAQPVPDALPEVDRQSRAPAASTGTVDLSNLPFDLGVEVRDTPEPGIVSRQRVIENHGLPLRGFGSLTGEQLQQLGPVIGQLISADASVRRAQIEQQGRQPDAAEQARSTLLGLAREEAARVIMDPDVSEDARSAAAVAYQKRLDQIAGLGDTKLAELQALMAASQQR